MSLPTLLNPGFWFDLTPVRMGAAFEAVFFVLFALCVISGSVVRILLRNRPWDKYQRIVLSRLARTATASGVTGFIILFCAFEEIQFFGSRFWMLVWAIGVTIALVRIWRYYKLEVPALRGREQSHADVNKYLPRRAR